MPSTKERKYIDKWLDEYAMPLPVILEACDATACQIGKPSFPYCDKIIEDWHKKGVMNLDDIYLIKQQFEKAKR